MKKNTAELRFEGCNLFRSHVCFSLLSGRSVTIVDIRPMDDDPGIKGLFNVTAQSINSTF